ncbi:unannotated protein [freshwater metagenome]|uniref:Unannotated protein n=1 Tax=freshwater metagenome TaxID=449393 RepID=A0A6J6MZZ0_9ZZZZ
MSAENVAVRPKVAETKPPRAEPINTIAPQLEPNRTFAWRSSSSLLTKFGSAAPNAGRIATDKEEITNCAKNASQILDSFANTNPIPQIACINEIVTIVFRRSNLSTIGPAIGEKKNEGKTYAANTSETRKVEFVASFTNPTSAT